MLLTRIRHKFGPLMIGGIIGFIAFVFIFSGIYDPKGTGGGDGIAGTVNGEPITIGEFNRELNQRLEFFKSLGGGKVTEAQIRQFRVRDMVFNDLVNRKLMVQEAERTGVVASSEEIREKIMEIPAFQEAGRFSKVRYKQVLEANQHTPSSFEKLMRDDLSRQQWSRYFRGRARVSDEEVRREFLVTRDKRDIKYVLLTTETGRKGVLVKPEEIRKYLGDSAKQNLVKSHFEREKEGKYKGKKLEDVQNEIARDLLAGEKGDEIRKVNEALAKQLEGVLTASASSDDRVNAILKPYGVTVKKTGLVNRQATYLPGVGEAKELMADAFAKTSPIDPAQGGKAKRYNSAAWWLVAVIAAAERPDLAKLDAEREGLIRQLASRKERELFEAWMKRLTTTAKIVKNDKVIGEKDDAPEAGG
jgi:peptidyl-prolyl cis-trans isomerase D